MIVLKKKVQPKTNIVKFKVAPMWNHYSLVSSWFPRYMYMYMYQGALVYM